MTDYFGAPANGAVAQPAQVPAAGDASMEDEIMVSQLPRSDLVAC